MKSGRNARPLIVSLAVPNIMEELTKAWEAARVIIADSARFPHIPKSLIRQMDRCIQRGLTSRAVHVITSNAERASLAIDEMFARASRVTGLSPDEILRRTDFRETDVDLHRIESAFAEVRAINFLSLNGFTNIEPLPGGPQKSADIRATRGAVPYAVEVATSIYDATGRFAPDQLSHWFVGRLRDEGKLEQLATTAARYGAQKVALGVIDTEGPLNLQTHREFLEAATLAWNDLGRDPTLHVCLVTGRVTLGIGPDDAVFPDW